MRPCVGCNGCDDAKADVIVTALRFESHTERRPARPAIVRPAAAAPHTRDVAVFAPLRSGSRGIEIRIGAARQARVIPVAAPFEGVAVHVVEAPRIGRVTTDRRGAIQRRPRLAAVVRLALEVGLLAAERVAKRRRRGRSGAARVFPLRLGRQTEFPIAGKLAAPSTALGESTAEVFRLREVDVADREIIAGRQFLRQRTRQRAGDALPEPLRGLVLRHPEAARQRDLDLIFAGSPLGLGSRAAHDEAAGRTPAEIDRVHCASLTSRAAAERRLPGPCRPRERGDRRDHAAEERSTRHLAHSIRSNLVRLPLRIAALSASLRNFAFKTRSTVTGQLNGTSVP